MPHIEPYLEYKMYYAYEFWFCPDDIKHCVSASKKKYVLDWPIVPKMWPVKIGGFGI
jgi:hypothetical protein